MPGGGSKGGSTVREGCGSGVDSCGCSDADVLPEWVDVFSMIEQGCNRRWCERVEINGGYEQNSSPTKISRIGMGFGCGWFGQIFWGQRGHFLARPNFLVSHTFWRSVKRY